MQFKDYHEKYGNVFGMYLFGSTPTLVVADLEMVKQVYVKDFHSFRDRPVSFVIYKRHLTNLTRHFCRK